MDKKTIRKHRDDLIELGLLRKDYDPELDSLIYFVPEEYRYLARKKGFRRAINEGRSFSIRPPKKEFPKAKYVPLASEFPRRIWEVAAWMKHDPDDWAEDDADIKEARKLLEKYSWRVPSIGMPHLDPDRYLFDWQDSVKKELMIEPLPRFFNLKAIYEAKWAEAKAEPAEGPSLLGAKEFEKEDYVKQRIGVAVRRRSNGMLRVIRVEPNLPASEECLLFTPSTDEVLVRQAVFHLNEVLEQRRLLIPGRYSLLLKDLRLFNFRYTPPPRDHMEDLMLRDYLETAGNYVHALAAAVWRAQNGQKRK